MGWTPPIRACARGPARSLDRARGDQLQHSGVTVVGFESSLFKSLDRELSVPQIELIYLSEDRHARLYQNSIETI